MPWQLWELFLLLLLEEVGVPLPFVTSSLMVAVGLAWRQGAVPLWALLAVAAAATCTGSLTLYAVGHFGGRPLVARVAHALKIRDGRSAGMEARLRDNGYWAILGSRFVPGMAPVASLAAGSLGLPVHLLLAGALTASMGWTLFWLTGGYVGYGLLAPVVGWLPPHLRLPAAAVCLALLLAVASEVVKRVLHVLSPLVRRWGL